MKQLFKSSFLLLLAVLTLLSLAACGETPGGDNEIDPHFEEIDYVSRLKLDVASSTMKASAKVKTFVDGDTTHFYVDGVTDSGVLKARYLAIDTPESTGKIEEWGKKAAAFTRSRLEEATNIIVESDTEQWNLDSTGDRYLVWVWYKTASDSEYRNLNLEILQNGLCRASATASNRYGDTCMAALDQAKKLKLDVHSQNKDPDFYYGDAIELSLIELRCNVESYTNQKVAFEGVITLNDNNSIYIEEYDPDTDMYYGISVYYGFGLSGGGLEVLTVGNRARIVGTVQYYEAGATYQVSGLQYRQMKPDDPSNIKKISDGHKPAYVKTEPDTFLDKKVTVKMADGSEKTFDYAYLALNTSVEMDDLQIVSIYTTTDPESSSLGAMTFTCTSGGKTVHIRTTVFRDETGKLITEDAYKDKNISVKGIIDYYNGGYQILVLTPEDITINK